MLELPVTPNNDQLMRLLKTAAQDDVVLIENGVAVGVVIALRDDDDRFDFELKRDPRFAKRISAARQEAPEGKTRKWVRTSGE